MSDEYNTTPKSRNEEILRATIDGSEYDKNPQSREEYLLLKLKEKIEEGGGGGGGTSDYPALTNKPQINGVELVGNKTSADLNIDAVTTEAVVANTAVGAIASGDTVAKNTSLTNFVKQLLIKEIAPAISFSASGSGVKEVGTSVTPTLTVNISNFGTGTPVSISFYSGSTLLETKEYVAGTSSYSHTMADAVTSNTTVKGVLNYKKSDGTSASVEKTASYTFVMASYYGAVSTAPTTAADITALTKNVKNTKALTVTFALSNQRSCYCYPASFGNLSSIKDANNFEYIGSYTKTTVTVSGTAYNVYTLTDPVTAASFKQIFA